MAYVVSLIAAGSVTPVPVSRPMTLAQAQEACDLANNAVAYKSARAGAPIGDRYCALNAESLRARA